MTDQHLTTQTSAAESPDAGTVPPGYAEWLTDLKARVRTTQLRAVRAANVEMLRLYWSSGSTG